MDDVVAALGAQHRELDEVLAPLDDAGWARPTPCEGWTVADVVLHLAQTDEMALGSATGRYAEVLDELTTGLAPVADIDAGAAAMVERERGTPAVDVHRRWRDGAARLRAALAAGDPSRRCTWVAGELSARTLATTRLAETWIHTGDVCSALGVDQPATDRLWHIARLAWRTLPYAFAREGVPMSGPVAFELVGPGGDPWSFVPDEAPATTVRGRADELCRVAGRRADPSTTSLTGEGPDVDAVLAVVRTYA